MSATRRATHCSTQNFWSQADYRSMGLEPFEITGDLTEGERSARQQANKVLGF